MAKKEAQKCADVLGIMSEFNKGRFLITAGEMTQEVIDACADTNLKGTITIKLEVKPVGRDRDTQRVNQIEILPSITITKPKHPNKPKFFFLKEDNTLTGNDPDQDELKFEEEKTTNG